MRQRSSLMPSLGPDDRSAIHLDDRQATYFGTCFSSGESITDLRGVDWLVVIGREDSGEVNYGIFDSGRLIAHVNLAEPNLDDPHRTQFWSVGLIQVVLKHQRKGIGSSLLDMSFRLHKRALASDTEQKGGGGRLWKRWIKAHPGKIELWEGIRPLGPVTEKDGVYSPNPWASDTARLVRQP